MKNILLAMLTPFMYPVVDGEGGGAADLGAGGADKGASGGADKPVELSLHDELSANMEIQEKGPEASDLSAAARRLAAARKGGTPAKSDEQDPAKRAEADAAAKKQADEKVGADAKAKRDAELAKLTPEERAKAEAEDKRKADEAAAGAKTEAPAHWPAAARELFAKQSPEVRTFLLDRHKAMEADYTKKMQELAPTRRLNDEMDEVFRPYDEEMRHTGVTRAQAIRELVGMHARLKKDPVEGLKYIAEISGVDLKKMVEGGAAADPAGESPTVKALRNEVSELTSRLTKLTDGHSAQQQNAQLEAVTKFAEEKDAQGQLKHPHFDEVAKDVAGLIRVAKSQGQELTLQDAYDRAIHANPTTREKLFAAKTAEQRAKDEADRKAKAEAARKASAANIEGEGAAAVVAAQTGSIREDLVAAFATHGDRV